MLNLSTFGVTQADDAADFAAINECQAVQAIALWNETDHAQFVVLEAFVNPDERFIPGELGNERQGQAVRGQVDLVFGLVEVDAQALV